MVWQDRRSVHPKKQLIPNFFGGQFVRNSRDLFNGRDGKSSRSVLRRKDKKRHGSFVAFGQTHGASQANVAEMSHHARRAIPMRAQPEAHSSSRGPNRGSSSDRRARRTSRIPARRSKSARRSAATPPPKESRERLQVAASRRRGSEVRGRAGPRGSDISRPRFPQMRAAQRRFPSGEDCRTRDSRAGCSGRLSLELFSRR